MSRLERHFVEFFSPGTFVAETTTLPIESWDANEARTIASGVRERYGATPYGFRFLTRAREDSELDGRAVATSPMHYLGGRILSLADVEARNDPADRILISNMRANGWDRVIENTNSYRWVQPFGKNDILL